MKFLQQKFDKPLTGTGKVLVGKRTFSFDLEQKGGEVEHFSFPNSALPEDLPDNFKIKNGGRYWFNIRADGSAINNIRPASGFFSVVANGVAKNEEGQYTVIESTGDFGRYWQFVVELIVTQGSAEGITFPLYLPLANENKKGEPVLKFGADPEGNLSPMGNPAKSTNIKRLFDFIIASGLVDITMVWKDKYAEDFQSFLGAFDRAIQKSGQTEFGLVVARGYPDSMTPTDAEPVEDEEVDDEVEDDDEVAAPVKSKSKVAPVDDDDDEVDEDDEDEDDEVVAKRPSFSKLKK